MCAERHKRVRFEASTHGTTFSSKCTRQDVYQCPNAHTHKYLHTHRCDCMHLICKHKRCRHTIYTYVCTRACVTGQIRDAKHFASVHIRLMFAWEPRQSHARTHALAKSRTTLNRRRTHGRDGRPAHFTAGSPASASASAAQRFVRIAHASDTCSYYRGLFYARGTTR